LASETQRNPASSSKPTRARELALFFDGAFFLLLTPPSEELIPDVCVLVLDEDDDLLGLDLLDFSFVFP
jgi:hypothetical protein